MIPVLPNPPPGWGWEFDYNNDVWYLTKKNHRSFKFYPNGYWEYGRGAFGMRDTRLEAIEQIISTTCWENIKPVV